jgi:hypothetical protein
VFARLLLFAVCVAGVAPRLAAQVTFATNSIADAFLCTGSPTNPELSGADLSGYNFGAAGMLVVAPASSPSGEFQSIVRFDLSGAAAMFDTAYGSNHWIVSGISLQLTSNFGGAGEKPDNAMFPAVSGGRFGIEWLSTNGWAEGTGTPRMPTMDGVCYNSIPGLLAAPCEILGTNTYTPPGNNIPVVYSLPLSTNLLANIASGGLVSFLFFAADNQIAYLFNAHEFAGPNEPQLRITASPLLQILTATATNGTFYLTGVGAENATCIIQANTNLATTNWQSIGTAATGANGAFQFTAPAATNSPQRFYRLLAN